jgi:hypothetical protein
MTLIRSSIQIHWPKKGKENKKSDPFFKLFRFLRPPLVAAPAKRGPIREPLATDSGKPQIPEGPKASAQSPVRFPAWHYKVVRTVPCAVPRSPFVLIRSTFAFQKSHPPFIHSSPFIPHSRSKKSIPLSQSLPAVLRPAMQAGLPVRLRPAMQAGPRLQAPKSHRLRRSRPQVSQHTTVKNRPLTLSCMGSRPPPVPLLQRDHEASRDSHSAGEN